tara:strand:- start:719 stop:1309 length:591 start_codon:yes stop_codon:yes gene_type:complete
MELIVATGNQKKLAEIRRILGDDFRWPLKSLHDVGFSGEEPAETESDFEGNALLKARYYQCKLGGIVIADDSGIECDDLDGYPGVHSARIGNDDPHRRQILLAHLKDTVPHKQKYPARFRCVIAIVTSDFEHTFSGSCEGHVKDQEKGTNGFGYDPIFYLDDGRSLAEYSQQEKNSISHRGRAMEKLKAFLNNLSK